LIVRQLGPLVFEFKSNGPFCKGHTGFGVGPEPELKLLSIKELRACYNSVIGRSDCTGQESLPF
jgi:hypothetical protein